MRKAVSFLGSSGVTHVVSLFRFGKPTGASLMLRFPEDLAYIELYFLGYVELGSVEFLQHFLRPEDIVFDVGANLGYFSLITAIEVPRGEVHAFEPIPGTFERLLANLALNPQIKNIVANQIGVAQASGLTTIHTFAGLHHGYSSRVTYGREDATPHSIGACSIDDYVSDRNLSQVDFIKIDVEGAEDQVLAGAKKTIEEHVPTVMFEANFEAARWSGFECRHLVGKLRAMHPYTFYRFPKAWGQLTPLRVVEEMQSGDNVVAVSPKHTWRIDHGLQSEGVHLISRFTSTE